MCHPAEDNEHETDLLVIPPEDRPVVGEDDEEEDSLGGRSGAS